MGISFRHDAAAVSLPSTSGSRKYGQSLVLQQQQQKYQTQQADLDRMFAAQQRQPLARDNWQWGGNQAGGGQGGQRGFGLTVNPDAMKQQAAEAERQREFLEEARKMQSGMIMEDIKNGEFDPTTSRKLQQNLVAEAEALGNPGLDATQRAEALQKIRAERALLSANRMQKPPEPSPQDQFNQGIVVDPETGMRYRQNSKGDYEPMPQPEQQQRPKSAQEYYAENEDAFTKDLDATMQAMQDQAKEGETVTREQAWEQMQEDYAFRQQALGMIGNPTAAPALPGTQPAAPRTERSILENPSAPMMAQLPDPGMPPVPGMPVASPDPGMPPVPAAPTYATPSQVEQAMAGQGYEQKIDSAGNPFWYKDGKPVAPPPGQSSQNPWAEVASGGQPTPARKQGRLPLEASSQTPTAANRTEQQAPVPEQPTAAPTATLPKPNFGDMILNAKDEVDRALIFGLERTYQGQPPEVQAAISAFVSPDSSDEEFIAARDYLKAAGIDLEKMATPPKKKSNRDWQSGKGM